MLWYIKTLLVDGELRDQEREFEDYGTIHAKSPGTAGNSEVGMSQGSVPGEWVGKEYGRGW